MGDTNGEAWAGSFEEWRQRRRANITLPSGMRVTVQTVTLDELCTAEALPDDLLRAALLEMTPGGVPAAIAAELQKADSDALARAKKLSEDSVSLVDRLCVAALVDPQVDVESVVEIDAYDKQMIAQIAQRRIDEDAAGRRVYGVQPVDQFRGAGEVG